MFRCVCGGILIFSNIFSWYFQYSDDRFGIKVSINNQIFFCLYFFQTVMTIIGDQPAVSHASVRMELCVILSKEPASVLQGLSGATVRTNVQPGTLGKVVCRSASVGLEDPVIKQLENVHVGMDSLGPCKCLNSLHEWKNNCFSISQKCNYNILTNQTRLKKKSLKLRCLWIIINIVRNNL